MSWIAVIGAILKLAVMFFTNKFEKDKKKQARKGAYLERAKEGIRNRDRSAITAYFDAARRL